MTVILFRRERGTFSSGQSILGWSLMRGTTRASLHKHPRPFRTIQACQRGHPRHWQNGKKKETLCLPIAKQFWICFFSQHDVDCKRLGTCQDPCGKTRKMLRCVHSLTLKLVQKVKKKKNKEGKRAPKEHVSSNHSRSLVVPAVFREPSVWWSLSIRNKLT